MESIAFIDEDGNLDTSGVADPVPWWSFSKTVLAIAAMRLVEKGLLALHGKISGEQFTLAQLLRHEAGLPDYGGVAEYHQHVAAGKSPWPVRYLLDVLDAKRPRYEPGRGWAYSNIGYLKVRELIEQVTDRPLGAALTELVFDPLTLKTARVANSPDELSGVQMGNRCPGYDPGWVYHGLVTGTTTDAARLLRALTIGNILQRGTFELMLERHALPEHRNRTFRDPAYGLGLMLNSHAPLDHPLGHRGGGPGSTIAVYAIGKKACAVWQTSEQDPDGVVDRACRSLRT